MVKGPQSRILHAKARSSARAPAYIEKKCAIPACSRVSATLERAGMAALNPKVSGNGALLLDLSRRARGGARLCV